MMETMSENADHHRNPPAPVLALVRDLMFISRIGGAANAAGVALTLHRDPAALTAAAAPADQQPPGPAARRLLVDLNLPGAVEAATHWKQLAAGREVVGFVSHVDTEAIARARAAGVDRVLARSRFVELLPELLVAPSAGPSAGPRD